MNLERDKKLVYLVMLLFVLGMTANYIITKMANYQQVTNTEGELVYFRHPVFQASYGMTFELITSIVIGLPI
jgi:hypothetical protein